jgi:hypothetical protein
MDPEVKRLLEETHALAKDNHRRLRAIRRGQWFSAILSIIFWLAVVLTPFYLYQQYVQPLIAKIYPASNSTAPKTATSSLESSATADFEKLVNYFKAGK